MSTDLFLKHFKPMLAFQQFPDLDQLKYPLCVSPKLDGIRCIVYNGVAYSRSLKPIRNRALQEKVKNIDIPNIAIDGELIYGDPCDSNVYLKTNSEVMSFEGSPDLDFYIFDCCDLYALHTPYRDRLARLVDDRTIGDYFSSFSRLHAYDKVSNKQDLLEIESLYISMGYEGAILRYYDAPYKFGRSTLNQGALLKLKRFTDAEAVIVEVHEAMYNDNDAYTNEVGRTQRSSAKAGRTEGKGVIGRFTCRLPDGRVFGIGSFKGLTDFDKARLWNKAESLIGKTVKFKYLDIGVKELPRSPVFLGFRDNEDL